ncbi:MAG TPA: DinB family protein [Pyrinomonadaceae bacterium]|jgi:hypothetical protein|nr:DinB family protein [Pyrinomonadaceae bacterium]
MTFETVGEIFETIEKTRNKLTNAVSILNEEQAGFRPDEEKWSAALIVEHLAKTEGNLVRVIGKLLRQAEAENKPSDGRIDPPVSFASIAETAQTTRFEAPEFIRPAGGAAIEESLAKLEKSRAALRELRPRIEVVDGSNAQYPHPAFGNMNLYYWLGFIGLHELRHLRQIQELLAAHDRQAITPDR